MNAKLGHDQRFEFERDQNLIRLDIPLAGITTSDKAWRITAPGPPLVCSTVLEKLRDISLIVTYIVVYVCVGGGGGAHFHVNFIFVHSLQIEKKEIDNFEKGKRIPSCQLVARCETERPTTLEHLVTLSGAKDPHNTFTIDRPCDSGIQQELV